MTEQEQSVEVVDEARVLRAKRMSRLRSGTSWMLAVGALSALNVVAAWSDFPLRLAIGVSTIDLIMAIGQDLGGTAVVIGTVASLAIAGSLFALAWGFKYVRALSWAPIPFIVFYVLDTVVALVFKDVIGVAFHVLALYYIIGGYAAYRTLLRDKRAAELAAPAPVQPAVASAETPA